MNWRGVRFHRRHEVKAPGNRRISSRGTQLVHYYGAYPGHHGKQATTGKIMVGTGGLEPPTPCSQGKCATRLRYVPTQIAQYSYVARGRGAIAPDRLAFAHFMCSLRRRPRQLTAPVWRLSLADRSALPRSSNPQHKSSPDGFSLLAPKASALPGCATSRRDERSRGLYDLAYGGATPETAMSIVGAERSRTPESSLWLLVFRL